MRFILRKIYFSLLCFLFSLTQLSSIDLQGSLRLHDPSTVVFEKENFYIFHTGRYISVKTSSNLTNWRESRPVFEKACEWWTAIISNFNGYIWAPDIAKFNGRWHLYYSVSSWGRNRSAIGVAINKTLDSSNPDYLWVDCGAVIESRHNDNFNAIDPAVFVDDDNSVWLAFGSFWSGIKLIELDVKTGKRISTNSPIYSLASAPDNEIEAPFIYKRGEYYYLFLNYGLCCRSINSTYNIRVGRSKDIRGPYLDKENRDMRNGGGSLFLTDFKNRIGPGHPGIFKHNGIEYFSYHYYDSNNFGRPRLMIQRLNWDENNWPLISQGE